MKKAKKYILLFVILLGLDVLSKWWVQGHLIPMAWAPRGYPYGGIGIFENFFGIELSIVSVCNRGAAWGSFASMHLPLLIVRVAITAALICYIFFWNKEKGQTLPLTMILAGAVGNIIDCFTYGYVIDMIHVNLWGYSYPIFNLADAYICIGVVIFIIESFAKKKKCKSRNG